MSQRTPSAAGNNEADPNTSSFSTDSLLSTSTAASTINLLTRGNPRTNEPKDYSAAFSVLQSRYGTGGHALPSPKAKPSDKLQISTAANATINEGSQSTLVSTPSIPSSSTTASTGTSAPSSSGNTTQPTDRKKVLGGIRSLFKGKEKGRDKK